MVTVPYNNYFTVLHSDYGAAQGRRYARSVRVLATLTGTSLHRSAHRNVAAFVRSVGVLALKAVAARVR